MIASTATGIGSFVLVSSGYLLFVVTLISNYLLPFLRRRLRHRSVSSVIDPADAAATQLGQAILPKIRKHPEKTGVHPLIDPYDAFASRLLLTRFAERTLDIQYYIWHKDVTGMLLLEALHQAADRGVRIRLLLDDNGTVGLDPELAAINSHPNIEVRLFNPLRVRKPKWINYLTEFRRLNRRMHNKSFTADNYATIIGGRNIGDEYFGATSGVLFSDLDVFAVGPVVTDVSSDFDRYWASESAYPAELVLPPAKKGSLEQLEVAANEIEHSPAAHGYISRIKKSDFITSITNGTLNLDWVDVRMISDDPAKGLGDVDPSRLMIRQLGDILGRPKKCLHLISAYFVPTTDGVALFSNLANQGVDIHILTNSLDATDVGIVHSGYMKRRKALLKDGINLYEMPRLSGEMIRNQSAGRFGSSGSSLHAKTFSVDDDHVFIGSFNFDPRSALFNTEMGFLIDSPDLAIGMRTYFEDRIANATYRVMLNKDGSIYWLENQDDGPVQYNTEPHVGFFRRGLISAVSMLPIERFL